MTTRGNELWLAAGLVAVVVGWHGDLTGRVACGADLREWTSIEDLATLTAGDTEDEFPTVGCDSQGRLWVAWVAYDGTQDRVLAKSRDGKHWSKAFPITANAGDHWRPAFGVDGKGRLWLTWAQNQEGNWDVWGRFLQNDKWSAPLRLTDGAGNDICQQLATDSTGQLWMVWQAVVDGDYEVMLARLTPEGLEERRNVSEHSASDWEPAIAAGKDGQVFIAWDSYRNGNYDILLRSLQAGKLGGIRQVTASSDYEAHAALAVDRQNRVWLAWDNGGPHWGRHGESLIRLHSQRSAHICCLDGDRLFEPAASVDAVFTGELAKFCELPELTVDDAGRLWLFVRHLQNLTPSGRRPNGRPHQARGIWNPYAICYSDGQWSQPTKLPDSNGRNDMRLAVCLDTDGRVWTTWADDGRKASRAEEPVNHNVRAARLDPANSDAGALPVRPTGKAVVIASDTSKAGQAVPPYTLSVGGTQYRLLYGDTHRHTDISRCAMNYDGSLMDTYRYAIDAARLDFLAISDHDQDLLKHRYDRKQSPLLGHAWWRSQKYCDLFYIPDRFLTLYGYEHGGSFARRGGHKNVIYLERGMPCYEHDSPEELFHVLRGKEAVVVPHQLADGGSATDWDKWNPDFERVAEIFQARGSYEYFGAPPPVTVQRKGNYLWDALSNGVGIGVIASSDHGLVHGAYAAVYATEFSRRAVLDGLRNRRSFGATDTFVLDFRLGDQVLGQSVEVNEPPTFDVYVRGNVPLKQVQIVSNGQFVYTTQPDGTECRFRYTDTKLVPGSSAYYYVRCEQSNREWAWSSAIWVDRTKP